MDKYSIHRKLVDNPDWTETLQEAIEREKAGEEWARQENEKYPNAPILARYLGWESHDVHTPPQTLRKMLYERLIDCTHRSRSAAHYLLRDRQATEKALEMFDSGTITQADPEEEIPNNLFNYIVGHDQIKKIFNKSIHSSKPTHILLYGPPATAKSLFLSELSRLPNSKMILGSSVSKAGLIEYLLEFRPKYIIFDELEKAASEDLATMLSLMETGMVTRLKHGKRETEMLKTWVFASANRINTLPEELKSRFLSFEVKPYTAEDVRKIAHNILNGNHDKEIIDRIVGRVVPHSKDVRDIIKVSNLVSDKEDVDMIVEAIWR